MHGRVYEMWIVSPSLNRHGGRPRTGK